MGDVPCAYGCTDAAVGCRHAGGLAAQRRGAFLIPLNVSPGLIDSWIQFLIPWARVGRCRDEVYDPKVGEKLWEWLEENTKA